MANDESATVMEQMKLLASDVITLTSKVENLISVLTPVLSVNTAVNPDVPESINPGKCVLAEDVWDIRRSIQYIIKLVVDATGELAL
jgi:vacuolar-type H+-ATPase subunit D/Vma8